MNLDKKLMITAGILALVLIIVAIVGMNDEEVVKEEVVVVDKGCLTNIANDYCFYNTFHKGPAIAVNVYSFNCVIRDNSRENTIEITTEFYFLDEEILSCSSTKLREVKK